MFFRNIWDKIIITNHKTITGPQTAGKKESMNQLEQDSLRFVALLSRMYFAERDLDGVLARMTDDVEWIGTGRQDGCRGIREARKLSLIHICCRAPARDWAARSTR